MVSIGDTGQKRLLHPLTFSMEVTKYLVRFGKQFYVESSLARLGGRARPAGLPIIILLQLSWVNQWNSLKIVYKTYCTRYFVT